MLLHDELLAVLLHQSGFHQSGSPTPGTQEELLQATLSAFARIPYENLSKIIAHAEEGCSSKKHSPEEVINGFIRYGTGGTCFPLTLTLIRFMRALGYEALPILADRRYGTDTHCAAIVRLSPNSWHLIDPGYLIYSPCRLPNSTSSEKVPLRYELPHGAIELRPTLHPERVELYTVNKGSEPRYRLTYKTAPVDPDTFDTAWSRSFSWEMMNYPVVSALNGTSHIYLQKNNLLVRSDNQSTRTVVTPEQLTVDIGPKLGIAPEVLRRALSCINGSSSSGAKLR